jgi:hypothetical protein
MDKANGPDAQYGLTGLSILTPEVIILAPKSPNHED